MRLLVYHKKNIETFIRQYSSETLNILPDCTIIDVDNAYVDGVNNLLEINYVEQDFTIKIRNHKAYNGMDFKGALEDSPILIAYIGESLGSDCVDLYYEINTKKVVKGVREQNLENRIVNLTMKEPTTTATFLLEAMKWLREKAWEYNLPLVVYSNLQIVDKKYSYRSFMQRSINEIMEQVKGIYICKVETEEISRYYRPSQDKYESYIENTVYTKECLEDCIKRYLTTKQDDRQLTKRFKRSFKEQSAWRIKSLYNDNFYRQIPDDEMIYVSLNAATAMKKEEYGILGIDSSMLLNGVRVLRGEKSKFDELSEVLQFKVVKNYYVQVLSRTPIAQVVNNEPVKFNLRGDNLTLKGKDVYIGIIGVEGIDYNNDVFKTADGKTRVAYMWEQELADEGKSYYAEDINAIMGRVPVEDAEYNTLLLGVAAGNAVKDNVFYTGLAVESELLVAKIKAASYNMQNIYSGNYSKSAVLIQDILIAIQKLVNFALEMKKPLVLLIPYGTNLSSHDGTLDMEAVLGVYAKQSGVTIITPAGEEADKQHHTAINWEDKKVIEIAIDVAKENQNVLLNLWSQFPNEVNAVLYTPENRDIPISLQNSQEIEIGGAKLWVRGSQTRLENGCQEIIIRMENFPIETYKLVVRPIFFKKGRIDVWLTQYPLNTGVTVSPSTPFVGITSLGNIEGVMCVGTYENKGLTVYRSSGRGYTWNNQLTPLLVTTGVGILCPGLKNIWQNVTGTAASAAILSGVMALLYERIIKQGEVVLPNTLVMGSIITKELMRIDTVKYPNESQGYGILNLSVLEKLLKVEKEDWNV